MSDERIDKLAHALHRIDRLGGDVDSEKEALASLKEELEEKTEALKAALDQMEDDEDIHGWSKERNVVINLVDIALRERL